MLAIADAFGNVFAAIPGLASVANVSIESTEKAVDNLLSPDPYSRTKDFEGRRIEAIDGGWHILNYGKYRKMMDEEERREYKAKWARESRRQKRTKVDKNGQASTPSGQSGHIPSASSSTSSCTQGDIEEYCISIGLPRSDGEAMFLHWQEKKWPKNWKLTIQKWKSFGYLPSQKQSKQVNNGQRTMSAFEIEKRTSAIASEINKIWKKNGSRRVDGDGIDELKQRRDELQKQLTA